MNLNILLVEPAYKNKYPPLGLMKLSAYHKGRGDNVFFVKGLVPEARDRIWDRVYVTTLFTFYFDVTVQTIRYYKSSVASTKDLYVGGILSSLMPGQLKEATGISQVIEGLLTSDKFLGYRLNVNIDELVPDYDILDLIDYKYPAGDNYFAYTTRGCPNKCPFCAVPKLEPEFKTTNHIKDQIDAIDSLYGQKRNLLLLDNNVLYSECLDQIVTDIRDSGFSKKASFTYPNMLKVNYERLKKDPGNEMLLHKTLAWLSQFQRRIRRKKDLAQYIQIIDSLSINLNFKNLSAYFQELNDLVSPNIDKSPKRRYVDFNQGLDARLLTDEKMKTLSKIPIRPFRIAFDDLKDTNHYVRAMKTAIRYGVKEFSNYILYNYKDKPEDLWLRLKINMELREELGVEIYSFPMKYIPIGHKNRDFIGEHWNRKYLRAIQSVLLVKKGIVSSRKDFFEKAFGSTLDEYMELLMMPQDMIIYRFHYEGLGTTQNWKALWESLSELESQKLLEIIGKQEFGYTITDWKSSPKLSQILPFYNIRFRSSNNEDQSQQLVIDELL